jgi:hypothetical protein
MAAVHEQGIGERSRAVSAAAPLGSSLAVSGGTNQSSVVAMSLRPSVNRRYIRCAARERAACPPRSVADHVSTQLGGTPRFRAASDTASRYLKLLWVLGAYT